jgi:uncharacterized protein YcfJ
MLRKLIMRKILYSTLVLFALTGCATHQQSNSAVGAVVGGAIGKQIGGTGGAILGAGMGAAIGGQQPTQRGQTVYVERQVIVPNRTYQCHKYVERERNCYNMRYRDTRAMCIEDARMHYDTCMSR